MPVTYLKGAGAALGRGVEAFQAQHDQELSAAISAGRSATCIAAHQWLTQPCMTAIMQQDKELRADMTAGN